LGQIYNVLIILVITLLMALATAAVAYFVDFIPWVDDGNGTQMANKSFGSPQLD
jgi:hypothetical protein